MAVSLRCLPVLCASAVNDPYINFVIGFYHDHLTICFAIRPALAMARRHNGGGSACPKK